MKININEIKLDNNKYNVNKINSNNNSNKCTKNISINEIKKKSLVEHTKDTIKNERYYLKNNKLIDFKLYSFYLRKKEDYPEDYISLDTYSTEKMHCYNKDLNTKRIKSAFFNNNYLRQKKVTNNNNFNNNNNNLNNSYNTKYNQSNVVYNTIKTNENKISIASGISYKDNIITNNNNNNNINTNKNKIIKSNNSSKLLLTELIPIHSINVLKTQSLNNIVLKNNILKNIKVLNNNNKTNINKNIKLFDNKKYKQIQNIKDIRNLNYNKVINESCNNKLNIVNNYNYNYYDIEDEQVLENINIYMSEEEKYKTSYYNTKFIEDLHKKNLHNKFKDKLYKKHSIYKKSCNNNNNVSIINNIFTNKTYCNFYKLNCLNSLSNIDSNKSVKHDNYNYNKIISNRNNNLKLSKIDEYNIKYKLINFNKDNFYVKMLKAKSILNKNKEKIKLNK